LTTESKHFDVAVVGGGPAGSSSAYHAARLGLKTILCEKRAFPREKPCGGALSARNISNLGENAIKTINTEIQEVRLYGPSYRYFSSRKNYGFYVIREEFDEAMTRDAEDAGALLWDHCPVTGVTPLPGGGYRVETKKGSITADYVILASGFQNNSIIKELGIRENYEKDYLAATVVSETPVLDETLASYGFERKILGIFFGAVPNGYGWCFVKKGYLNIGIGATGILLKKTGAIRTYRQFIVDLKERGILPGDFEPARERAFPLPFKKTASQTVFDRVLLVGDAAGFVSPVSGEGLFYGIRSGVLAAEAIKQHKTQGKPLACYQKNWLQEFGRDLNGYGAFLQKHLYKNNKRMELVITLGRNDKKMAGIFNKMLYGVYNYKQTFLRVTLRLPISLLKMFFKKKEVS